MPLTVSAAVANTVGQLAGTLAALGLPTTADDTNTAVVRCVRAACRWVSVVPADPTTVTDADLLAVAGSSVEKLFDAARLETLYYCLGNAPLFDVKVGDNSQSLSQVRAAIQAEISALEDRLRRPYGPNTPPASVGQMAAGRHLPNDPFRPGHRPEYPLGRRGFYG